MIDPILSLAFSVQSNKGVYALLLGSGVSRAAGIPTGWEIVLDLLRKLAHVKSQNREPAPEVWYRAAFGEEPDYPRLLDALARSPAERSQLLRPYFEPNEEERQQGLKVPTPAHKAIGELVAAAYIRVIVTTNFDRLLEEALEATGIVPTVISTPDAAQGVLPLAHSRCAVIKVHGDYLDTRIKNSPPELAEYDEPTNRLLDEVFDQYGLIVCGWSAEWDTALRAAMARCKSRRFTTYWTSKGEPAEPAKQLIRLRGAELIPITDASAFFSELAEKVLALASIAKPHPLSAKVAVATLKRYVSDDRYEIDLSDLVLKETERTYGELPEKNFPAERVPFSTEELIVRVSRYEAVIATLLGMLSTGCYWGREQHEGIWVKSLSRIASLGLRNGLVVWLNLRKYPALLLLYAAGIGALAGRRPATLAALLTKAVHREGDEEVPAALGLYGGAVIERSVAQQLPEMERRYTPVSDHLYKVLRETCREFLLDDTDYQRTFDRFEYLLGLVHADLREKREKAFWGPVGCFGWRRDRRAITEIETEVAATGDDWPLLQAGLFDGSTQRFLAVKKAFDEMILDRLVWY